MGTLGRVHRRLLEERRHVVNLVGPGDASVHFEDALAGLGGLCPSGRWVDLGSGAGFPGLVWADALPELAMDLVDSRRKRTVFLEAVVREAGVAGRVRVHPGRVEQLPAGAYDGAVTRAFAPPPEALAAASRLVRSGGTVSLFLAEGEPPAGGGATLFHVERYQVGGRPRLVASYRVLGTAGPAGA